MSRRQQQATLVQELQAKVHLTPLKEEDRSSCETSPARQPAVLSANENATGLQRVPAVEHTIVTTQDATAHSSCSDDGGPLGVDLPCAAQTQLFDSDGVTTADDDAPAQAAVQRSPSPPTSGMLSGIQLSAPPSFEASRKSVTPSSTARRVIMASPHANGSSPPSTASSSLTSSMLAAYQHQLLDQRYIVVAAAAAPNDVLSRSAAEQRGRSQELHDANCKLTAALEAATMRVVELEAIVKELSATVHRQAADLEAEKAHVKGLTETLTVERASRAAVTARSTSATGLSAAASRTGSRPSSPYRGATGAATSSTAPRTSSPFNGTASSVRVPSAAGSSTRTSSPSIARPTFSSSRRSPSLPDRRPSPSAQHGAPLERHSVSSAGRTMSPMATRQQLATATFMKSTTASTSRTASAAPTSASSSGAARPRLGGGTARREDVAPPVRVSTTVVMQNGVVMPHASTSSTTRKITPARERVEAAIARMLHSPQASQQASSRTQLTTTTTVLRRQ